MEGKGELKDSTSDLLFKAITSLVETQRQTYTYTSLYKLADYLDKYANAVQKLTTILLKSIRKIEIKKGLKGREEVR